MVKCHVPGEEIERAHQVHKVGKTRDWMLITFFLRHVHAAASPLQESVLYAEGEATERHVTAPEGYLALPPGTTRDTSGLSMSRISGGHGTMKQDLGICCEICLTLLSITMTGAPKEKSSRSKRVGGCISVTVNCFASVQIVITEQINATMIEDSYINEDSIYGDYCYYSCSHLALLHMQCPYFFVVETSAICSTSSAELRMKV